VGKAGFPHFPHPAPTLRFAVVIARSAGGVVLVFNRYRKLWELPGGLIDAGETPRDAAQRELLEEAECHARDLTWLGVVEVNDGAAHFGAVFRCEVDAVPVKVQNEEIGGIAFWQRGASPQPLGETDAALLTRFG
jgi:8-oxo-dGTP diphosphatase